jgi:putative toxin-antitoxin system antitoxin component (TIGR02293 family)
MNQFSPKIVPSYLPGAALLGLQVDNLFDLGSAVQSGLPTTVVETLREALSLSLSEMNKLIGLSESTYHHYRSKKQPLPSEIATKLYQLARVLNAAENFFEDKDRAVLWLKTPRNLFRNLSPLQCAMLPEGTEYVITTLNRLEHGVYL